MSFQFQSVIQECHSFPAVNEVVLMFRGQLDEGQMALSTRQWQGQNFGIGHSEVDERTGDEC
jgi:hypothetical protein